MELAWLAAEPGMSIFPGLVGNAIEPDIYGHCELLAKLNAGFVMEPEWIES